MSGAGSKEVRYFVQPHLLSDLHPRPHSQPILYPEPLPQVNGFYQRDGEYGGAPLFKNGQWWLLQYTMRSGNSYWYIADKDNLNSNDGDMYRVQDNGLLPPTTVQWLKAKDGVLPAPTLRASSGGA